jgi:hypothetical protein
MCGSQGPHRDGILVAILCQRSVKDGSAAHNRPDVVSLQAWEKEAAPWYVV